MRRKRDEEFPQNGFEAWGGYMQAKILKLQDQIAEQSTNTERVSSIFDNISIFVNGYTSPSAEELRVLITKHGGTYHIYQTPNDYVIASNLPDTKLKKRFKYNIVKPDWIVDSISAKKILDFRKYLLNNTERNQTKLQLTKTNKNESNVGISAPEKHAIRNENLSNSTICQNITKVETAKTTNLCDSERAHMTAVDPNFLSEFYNNSRLHHISTLAAELKNFVNQLRKENHSSYPARKKLLHNISLHPISEDPVTLAHFKGKKVIMHIDMDCFFVSVGLMKRPDLKGCPVAVTHSKGSNLEKNKEAFHSMSEIASCSYEARAKGLRNGMFMGQALRYCPDLKTIPYDFQAYKEVAFKLYSIISRYTVDIEAVSCDEMYVDCTNLLNDMNIRDINIFATELRKEILSETCCTCSAGFGSNRLQARLATKKAKPNGQWFLTVEFFFDGLPLGDLPGIGRQQQHKLSSNGYTTCGSIRHLNKIQLQELVGAKGGNWLYEASRGIDNKALTFENVRKSVSTEVNYGIRFETQQQSETFLEQLCDEVHNRLTSIGMKGKSLTLKIMIRAKDAPVQTAKFMGHGICDTINKSKTLTQCTDDLRVIKSEIIKLCRSLNLAPSEMRGVGIHISKLENSEIIDKKAKTLTSFWTKNSVANASTLPDDASRSFRKNAEEVKKKIIKTYGLTRQRIIKEVEEVPAEAGLDKKEVETTSKNTEMHNIFELGVDNVKHMLKAWLSTPQPLDCDVEIILAYLTNLVETRRIEKLRQLIIFLTRKIKERETTQWSNVYENITANIQEVMVKVYGKELHLPFID